MEDRVLQDGEGLERLEDLNRVVVLNLPPEGESIGNFTARRSETGQSVRTFFDVLYEFRGPVTIELQRSVDGNRGNAKVIQTYTNVAPRRYEWLDADPVVNGREAHYWLRIISTFSTDEQFVGPADCPVNVDQATPDDLDAFDVSKGAGSGNIVTITVAVRPKDEAKFGSSKIYVSGYDGVAGNVLIAQDDALSYTFRMKQTGEAVVFSAVAVSRTGKEGDFAGALTKAITLNAAATVPTKIVRAKATELSTGVQIDFSGNNEADVIDFKLYRGERGAGFGAAVLIDTIVKTSTVRYSVLDADGLKDQNEWYVLQRNAIGLSGASDAILANVVRTSADVPSGMQQQSNTAVVDSIDAGADTTVRVYDSTGGVGTDWTRTTGFGSTLVDKVWPAQTFTGKAYATTYICYYDGATFILSTEFFDVLPDGYFVVGVVTTVAAGGAGGSFGGGGGSGFGGGGGGGIGEDLGAIY